MFALVVALLVLASAVEPRSGLSKPDKASSDYLIKELLRQIQQSQVTVNQPDYHPPLGWSTIKGSWPSEARFNFHGNPAFALIRDTAYAADNDAFVTGWLLQMVLESVRYGNLAEHADVPSSLPDILGALAAFNQYRDHNYVNGSGLVGFFKQKYNATAGLWYANPDNLNGFLEFANATIPWKAVIDILRDLHDEKDLETIQFALRMIGNTLYAFHLPSDFDDSFLNLGLGATLKALKDIKVLPDAFDRWRSNNKQIEQLITAVKKYAYRPFSSVLDENMIDPRSYFYMHAFVTNAQKNNQSLALVTTWAQNLSDLKKEVDGGVHMPFNLNNVDAAVCANTVSGIVTALLEHPTDSTSWFDDDVKMILHNTSALISYVIDSGLVEVRPDIILLYYPSAYTFYWFVGRTVSEVENAIGNKKEVLPEVMEVYQMLSKTLRKQGTKNILEKLHFDANGAYFDDFLGNNDTDLFGKHVNNARDRLYSTSMAANALLRIWTYFDEQKGCLVIVEGIRPATLEVIFSATAFLRRFIATREYSLMNDFFSGSFKGLDTLHLWYPATYKKFANGTDIPENDSGYDKDLFYATVGVSGPVDEATYSDMVYNQVHFGRKTPLVMTSYNAPNNFFPFWSSSSLTLASALQTISFVDNLCIGKP